VIIVSKKDEESSLLSPDGKPLATRKKPHVITVALEQNMLLSY
jgi:hypothetical protein